MEELRSTDSGYYEEKGAEGAWDGSLIGAKPGVLYRVVAANMDHSYRWAPWSFVVHFQNDEDPKNTVIRFYQMLKHQRYELGPDLWNQTVAEGRGWEVARSADDFSPDPVIRCGYRTIYNHACVLPATHRISIGTEIPFPPRCKEHAALDLTTDIILSAVGLSIEIEVL